MKLFLGIFIVLCLPALLLQSYFAGNWYSIFHDYSLAMFFGIISFTYFLLVLVLGTRIRFLDQLYGQDRLLVFHSYLALLAFLFACLHIVFKINYVGDFDLQLTLGAVAFSIFSVVVLLALLFMVNTLVFQIAIVRDFKKLVLQKIKTDYSQIKFIHNAVWIAICLITIHVFLAISTQETLQRSSLIIIFGTAGISRYLYHVFFRRILNKRYQFSVSDVQLIHQDITQLSCIPKSDKKTIKFKAGQFAYLRVLSDHIGKEEHPFTISSAPQDKALTFTIKALGNYTSQCGQIQPGAEVEIDGPYGRFTPLSSSYDRLVFVAGGIGITPFLSILSTWKEQNNSKQIILLWSVKHRSELVQKELIESLFSNHSHLFSLKIFVSRENLQTTQKSDDFYYFRRMKALDIQSIFSESNSRQKKATGIYICGPQALLSFAKTQFKSVGIKNKQVHFERFFI